MRKLLTWGCFCFLCLWACTDHDNQNIDTDKLLTVQNAINNTMSYIGRNGGNMEYLTQRRYSATDLKHRFAKCYASSDSLWVYIPLVRYLNDSTSTVDSLKCQPIRSYALSFFKGSEQMRELWFVEEQPTIAYHRNHIMAIWYNQLTGRQRYFSESGRLVSSKKLYQGINSSLTRVGETDSSDIWEIELPEVDVTAPYPKRGGYWGSAFSPWGNLPIFDIGSGNIGEIGSDVGAGTGGSSDEKKPEAPIEDCVDTLMRRSKETIKELFEKILQSTDFSIGTQNLHSVFVFQESVRSDREVEWSSIGRNFTSEGRGFGFSDVRTDHKASSCRIELLESDHAATLIIHNHPNGSSLSVTDIMTLLSSMENHPNLNTIMAWDDRTDTYYCATINNREKALEFYKNYKNCVDKDTGFWDMKNSNDIKTFLESDKNKVSFSRYGKEDYFNNTLAAILTYFDAGVSLVKIENQKDAGGDRETFYTSYGAFKYANGKYIHIKYCRQ